MKEYNFLGKKLRNRFGFPSGVIATNTDTARWMLNNIPQLGFYVGKSTTIEPKEGYSEDILTQESVDSLRNAVGYSNPGLEETVESFKELIKSVPDDIFLMPQIGEGSADKFAYCASVFDKIPIDGIELNLSCPHAISGGILIGSDPKLVYHIVSETRKATTKPLIVKLNAAVADLEDIALAALNGGANALSAINTIGGNQLELSNKYGGLSGVPLFPITYDAVQRIRQKIKVPMIVMGGISDAADIRMLDKIDNAFLYGIGSALKNIDSERIKEYFFSLEQDLCHEKYNTARYKLSKERSMDYQAFVVKNVIDLNQNLRVIQFYQSLEARPAQYVFLKIGEHAKPFSVASDKEKLEILVKKRGAFTAQAFHLRKNNIVRIRGPYGQIFEPSKYENTVFVGAGCGIAPIYHAVTHNTKKSYILIGANNKQELAFLDELQKYGKVACSTEDGSAGYKGLLTDMLESKLQEWNLKEAAFFNCGPEQMLKKADEIERKYTTPHKIFHLVERMTSCGIGICGKCSIPNGKRGCVDGPYFDALEFQPGEYTRDKSGKKIYFKD